MDEEIFSLLKKGYSYRGIQNELNLTNNELYMFLCSLNEKLRSNYAHTKFYSDGRVETTKDMVNDYAIITDVNSDTYNFVIISDTHFGSFDDDIRLLDFVYNYCIKHGIHNIFHNGDLVDGKEGKTPKKLSPIEQIEFVINAYPHDNGIKNFITLGNHDFDLISEDVSLTQEIIDHRDDLIPMGYGTNKVFVKNNYMLFEHFIPINKYYDNHSHTLIFKGHSHRMKLRDDNNNYYVSTPALSKIDFKEKHLPGFLDVTISFQRGYIDNVVIKNFGIINNQQYLLNIDHLRTRNNLPPKDLGLNVEKFVKIKK